MIDVLLPGDAAGEVLMLAAPLSFWGGVDPATGEIIDRRHPQAGAVVTGRMLVLPGGRGSSSAASVLAEAIRRGTAPAAILLGERDEIIFLGALVAADLYGTVCPVVVVGEPLPGWLRTGVAAALRGGKLTSGPS